MQAKRGRMRPPYPISYPLTTNKGDTDGLAINNPAMPCETGQAGKNGNTVPEYLVNRNEIVFFHNQTRVGSGATWVDDAAVRGVGRLGGVWGHR